jgi:type I restriction enzyme S subunit
MQTQEIIGDSYFELSEKIDLNRRMNVTLEAIARALFQSWFVDFDPVRAKLDGRHFEGIDDAIMRLFPSAFQKSVLGEIPHGWRIGTLGELVELRMDRIDPTPAKDDRRYIALEDMPSRSIDLSKSQLGAAVNSSITAFRKGDILFGSMRPYFHKVGLGPFDGITRTTTFVLRPKSEIFRHFALTYFSSDDVVAYATTASIGTTIPYVKWDSLQAYQIVIPPDSVLAEFEKTIAPLVSGIAAHGEESRTLTSLRDTLLPRLLSGELRLAKSEREMEHVP